MLTVAERPLPSMPVTRPLILCDTDTVGGVTLL